MSTRKPLLFSLFVAVSVLGASTVLGQTNVTECTKTVSSIDTSRVSTTLNQNAGYSYRDYYNGRNPNAYRFRNQRRYYRPYQVYYYAPAYRYPPGVYPRTANMMYYGPAVKVYQSPWVYSR